VDEYEMLIDDRGEDGDEETELLKTCQFEMSLDATLNKEEEQV
jgi:hypothetical protein